MKKLPHDREITLEYFRSLVAIAMADGILKESEQDFFREKAHEIGLEVENIEALFSVSAEDIESHITHEVEDEDFLTDIVGMAMIDNELHEKEYIACLKLAERRGFTKDDVNKTIQWITDILLKDKKLKGF